MPIKGLPVLDRCCFCVNDLKLATYLIGVYSMCDGLTYSASYVPFCKELHSRGALGVVVRTVGTFNHVAGLALFGISVALIVTTWQNRPITTVFIITAMIAHFLVLVFHLLSALYAVLEGIECELTSDGLTAAAVFINNIVLYGIVQGMIAVYFAIVVNSYATKLESEATEPPPPVATSVNRLTAKISRSSPSSPPSPSNPPDTPQATGTSKTPSDTPDRPVPNKANSPKK